ARGAEAVDLHACDCVAEAGGERAHAGDVAACFADRIDAAHHHIVDLSWVEMVAVLDRLERGRRQMERRRRVQRAVRLAAPARGAHVIVNEGVGHVSFSLPRERRGVQISRSGCWWLWTAAIFLLASHCSVRTSGRLRERSSQPTLDSTPSWVLGSTAPGSSRLPRVTLMRSLLSPR